MPLITAKTTDRKFSGHCPLNGKCLTESLVYSAKIETPSENFTYIGMTEGSFKTRYNNHNASFRLPQY